MKSRVQFLRHTVQLSVLLFLVWIPVQTLVRVADNRMQWDSIEGSDQPTLPQLALRSVRDLNRKETSSEADLTQAGTLPQGVVRGNTWSGSMGPISYTDPMAVVESALASRSLPIGLAAGLILPLAIALMVGRVFCSWICPAGTLFEWADALKQRFFNIQTDTVRFKPGRDNKYLLLAAGLTVAFIFSTPVLVYLYPPAWIGREIGIGLPRWLNLTGGRMGVPGLFPFSLFTLALLGIILVEGWLLRRFWCRYICPGGALYSVLSRWKWVGLRNQAKDCTHCKACVEVCPMGLNPMANQFGMECDHCLKCVSACKPGSIGFDWSLRLKRVHESKDPVGGGRSR